MKKSLLFAGFLSAVACCNASAQSYNPYYPSNVSNNYGAYSSQQKKTNGHKQFSIGMDYVIGSMGLTNKNITIESPLPGGTAWTTNTDNFDDSLDVINGNIGWRPFRYLGFEAFYQKSLDNNEVKHRESYVDDVRFAQAEYKVDYEAYGLDAIGYVPVSSWLEILGTVGVANYDCSAELNFNAYKENDRNKYSSVPFKQDESKVAFRYGLGAQVWLSQRLTFRAMYRYTEIGGSFFDDISEVALGVRYNF